MDKKLNFKVGSYVFVASHGLGCVTDVVKDVYFGTEITLYKMFFEKDKLELLIPTSRLKDVGARPLIDKKTANWIFSSVLNKGPRTSKGGSWTTRMLEAGTKVDSGSTVLIAEVARDLHISANDPNKSYLEKSIYEKAINHLVDELKIVLSLTKEEVYKRIIDVLNVATSSIIKEKAKVTDDFSEDDDIDEIYKDESSDDEDEEISISDSDEDEEKSSKKGKRKKTA